MHGKKVVATVMVPKVPEKATFGTTIGTLTRLQLFLFCTILHRF